jgi:ATP-dependent Zn protease
MIAEPLGIASSFKRGREMRAMETAPTLRQTAWHEAGHAVVAWEQGFTVTCVSIRPEGSRLGRSQHTPAGDGAVPSERQRENIVALAGWAAELASGEANENGTYDSGDLTFVLSRLDQHAPARIEIELGWAESEAQRIVSANLERIERLAHEIMSREELTNAAEILYIIEGRPPV